MVDRTLAEFVKDALAKGASRADIEGALTAAGWPAAQVRTALAAYADTPFGIPAPLPRAYVSAREAFLYLVLFILLGVLATHLGALLFVLIDVFLPRDTPDAFAVQWASWTIRWSVSALTVALPLYLLLSWRLWRARRANPAMQGSRVRKWLTYLTLVITASTLIGDLITLVFTLLAGDLTFRFFLKTLVIAVIAGVIFLYYVRDAERAEDGAPAPLLDRAIGGGVALVTIAAAITGVVIIDSPATLRARERDDARLTALAETAGAIDCYATYEGRAPDTLEDMRAALDERAATTTIEYACTWYEQLDPGSGAPYEYRRISDTSYELCAVFDGASEDLGAPQTRSFSWRSGRGYRTMNAVHGAGRHCFTLEAESLAEPAIDLN